MSKFLLFLEWGLLGGGTILGIYFLATTLQLLTVSLFEKRIPLSLGFAIIGAVYTTVCWIAYGHLISLSVVLPWMGWIALLGGILAFLICGFLEEKFFNLQTFWNLLKPLEGGLFLFFGLLGLYVLAVEDGNLPLLMRGGEEIWDYGKGATGLLQTSPSAFLVNFEKGGALGYFFPSGLAALHGGAVIDILGLAALLVATLSVFLVKELCLKIFRLRPLEAYGIAFIWGLSPFALDLMGYYLLAQWIGVTLFLALMLKFFEDGDPPLTQLFFFGLVGFLLLATNSSLLLPYMGALLVLSLLQKGFNHYTKVPSTASFISQFWILLCAVPLALGWTALVDFPHLPQVWSLIFKGFFPSPGITYDLINPFALIFMLEAKETLKIIGYVFLFFAMGNFLLNQFQKNILTAPQFSLGIFFLGAVTLYLLYTWIGGSPSPSWAFAAALLYPLSFLFLAFLLNSPNIQKLSASVPLLILGVIGISVIVQAVFTRNETFLPLKEYAPLRSLKALTADPHLKEITLDLEEDPLGAAIASQFCPSRFIIVLSEKAYDWFKAFPQTGILCRTSPLLNPTHLVPLGESFFWFQKPPLLAKNYLVFFINRPPPLLRWRGLGGPQEGGRVSISHQVSFDIPTDQKWRRVWVAIKVLPSSTTPSKQKAVLSVQGIKLKEMVLTKKGNEFTTRLSRPLFRKGVLSLAIDFPSKEEEAAVIFKSLRVKAE